MGKIYFPKDKGSRNKEQGIVPLRKRYFR